jgi:hypothetical protein
MTSDESSPRIQASSGATSRQIVMHPRTAAARRRRRSRGGVVRGHVADPASVRELVARQRRLALSTLAVIAALVLALPAVAAVWDGLSTTRIGRMPIVWLLVGPVAFPVFVVVARRHQVAADRVDAEWSRRVDGDDDHGPSA